MKSENILEEANRITSTDRRQAYGSASVEFNRVANMWTAFLGDKLKEPLTAHDYGAMMVLLKVARYAVRRGRDDLVDISGYARTLEMVREGEVITRPVSDEVGIEAELGSRALEKSLLVRKTYQELFAPIPQDADIEGLEELFDQNPTVEPSGDGEEQVLDFIEKEGAALSSRGPLLSEICVADGGIKKAEEYCGLCRRCLCSKCADWHKVRCGIPLTSDDPDQIRVELDYFAKKVVRPSNAEDLRWVDNTGFDIKPS